MKALKFAKTMDVDLIALGGDLVNFPSPESVNDVYEELTKLPGLCFFVPDSDTF